MKTPKKLDKFSLIVIILALLLITALAKIWDLNSEVSRLSKQNEPAETAKFPLANTPEFVEAPERNKEEKYEVLGKLSVEVQINYFIKLLGSPLYINPVEGDENLKEYIFVDEDFFVQAITDTNNKILSYAVTSRKKEFNPTFEIPSLFKVSLNKTPFSKWLVDKEWPLGCYRFIGAHDPIYYFEDDYFGNPGLYLTYLVGINNSAPFEGVPNVESEDYLGTADCATVSQKDREKFSPNTFIVRVAYIEIKDENLENDPGIWFGPNNIQLRTLNE